MDLCGGGPRRKGRKKDMADVWIPSWLLDLETGLPPIWGRERSLQP